MATPEEADAKVKSFTIIGFVWFLAGMGIWCALGYLFIGYYNDPQYEYDQASRDLFISMAIMFIFFGIISLIFGILGFSSVLGNMKDDKYDTAYNRGLLMGFIGLFFGLGAGLMLVLAAKKFLKNHPKYLATLPVPTPVCERCGQPVTFDKEAGGWFCPTCKIHLTKGAPKPKAPSKPILPPTPPPKPKPKPVYGPKPGYGPKPMGPPGPGMHQPVPPPKGVGPQAPGHHGPMGPKPMGPPGVPPPKPYGPPGPKPMGPPGVPPPKPYGPPGPKPMGPPGAQPPGGPGLRNLHCAHCGKNFQWNMADPSIRMAKCPWCNSQVPL